MNKVLEVANACISCYPAGTQRFEAAAEQLGNLFSSQAWFKVLQRQNDFEFYWLQNEFDEGLFVATFSNLSGHKVVSLPFCDYSLTTITSVNSFYEFVAYIKERWPGYILSFKLLNQNGRFKALEHEATGKAYRHIVPLHSIEEIQANYHPSFRRGVKKARQQGVEVRLNTSHAAALRYYELHRKLRLQKFRSLPQPRQFFQDIHAAFIESGNGFFLEAIKEGELLASMLILQHRDVLYYKFGASDKASLSFRPNNMLFDYLYTFGLEQGFKAVDLGISKANKASAGLVRFKDYMGAIREDVLYLEYMQEDARKRHCTAKRYLQQLTEQLVRDSAAIEIDAYSSQLYPNFA